MSLLNLLLSGGIPQPHYNPAAIGTATLVFAGMDPGTTVENTVPMIVADDAHGVPALRISVASDEHVEISLAQLLDFARELTGVDLAALFGQVSALL